jgi:predicted nucleic acid-binding protein
VRIAIAVKAVFDASVFVRAGAYRSTEARTWTARIGKPLRVVVPDLVWLEIANALKRRVTVAGMAEAHADAILTTTRRFPLEIRGLADLAQPALAASLAQGLSVYDAAYLVLAEALDATLVTADRRLAEAASRAELIA